MESSSVYMHVVSQPTRLTDIYEQSWDVILETASAETDVGLQAVELAITKNICLLSLNPGTTEALR